ncbi:MBL fold metallo-hydrolase [Arthrobacter monumenti]
MFTKNVADGIHRIENAYVNVYLVEDGNRVAIIDSGLPAIWPELKSALAEIGADSGKVSHLALTHAHFDHLGVAAKIQSEYNVPVLVHRSDAFIAAHPYRYKHEKPRFTYPVRYPKAVPMLLAMAKAGALKVKGLDDMRYLDMGMADYLPGNPEIIHTPGHTAGHAILHFPERDAVICGDALVTLNPYTGKRGPHIVAGAATEDSKVALESLDLIAATGASTLLPGHGDPWTGGAEAAVRMAKLNGPS